MINNIDIIQSEELRKNILNLYQELVDITINNDILGGVCSEKNVHYNRILYNHVLGIGVPISICDGVHHIDILNKVVEFNIAIDYRVTSGYKPYQDLDRPIKLTFHIDKASLRDSKIDSLLIK